MVVLVPRTDRPTNRWLCVRRCDFGCLRSVLVVGRTTERIRSSRVRVNALTLIGGTWNSRYATLKYEYYRYNQSKHTHTLETINKPRGCGLPACGGGLCGMICLCVCVSEWLHKMWTLHNTFVGRWFIYWAITSLQCKKIEVMAPETEYTFEVIAFEIMIMTKNWYWCCGIGELIYFSKKKIF